MQSKTKEQSDEKTLIEQSKIYKELVSLILFQRIRNIKKRNPIMLISIIRQTFRTIRSIKNISSLIACRDYSLEKYGAI